ncbi:hypothetical protein ACFW3Y_08830 [Streptomyces rochei]|uniref:hypothetical protein n=1 Tax=Streptomyces rochei TaxID=1928 RepID=UPI0036CA662B
MPKPLPSGRRARFAVWAVLCAAGVAAVAALNVTASPASGPRPEERENPVSAECAAYIADIEAQLAEAGSEHEDGGVLSFTRRGIGAEDCGDEVLDHFGGDRSTAPPRVYSSCLAVDTEPVPAGGDPCGGP